MLAPARISKSWWPFVSLLVEDQDLPDSGDEDSDDSDFGYEEDSEEDSALSSSRSLSFFGSCYNSGL